MIIISDKSKCSGCTACRSVCPKQCISMEADSDGFVYPTTDMSLCINCNLCNKVCPIQNYKPGDKYPFDTSDFYAAKVDDESVLLSSSSGGIFSLLSAWVINDGGVAFGAVWDGTKVRHIGVTTIENLPKLRGSKYVQSEIGHTFPETKRLLSEGRRVLFSGTPCQIGGLNAYLKKAYPNLITAEVACHGVPSPKVLEKYIFELQVKYHSIDIELDFRAKPRGWLKYNVQCLSDGKIEFSETAQENVYMRGFLHELYSRPACHSCIFKGNVAGADFTLADCWGIENIDPDFPFAEGASLVILNSNKAKELWGELANNITAKAIDRSKALDNNGSLLRSERPHPERDWFFKNLGRTDSVTTLIERCLKMRRITRLGLVLKSYYNRIR